MPESFEELVARVNRGAFIPQPTPTAAATARSKHMAKPVKLKKNQEFQFRAATGGGESKYPWDEWLNGELLLIEQSLGTKDNKGTVVNVTEKRDYEVDTDAMPGKLKNAARRRYKVVQISRLDADGTRLENALIIRARDMDAAERADEDVLRAEEREAMKERRKKDAAKRAAASNGTAATAAAPQA